MLVGNVAGQSPGAGGIYDHPAPAPHRRPLAEVLEDLKRQGLDRLIVGLRGNIGGSMGFAHLAGYLCSGQVAIGHSVTPQRLRTGYNIQSLTRVPIPGNRVQLIAALGRFAFQDKSIMVLTQGLESQPFHNRVVILMNEHTNSGGDGR